MSTASIEGTYKLVRRELPDGTVQVPPMLKGMYTYTRGYRNFSVVWIDDRGKYYSESYAARYTLSETTYSETSEYLIVHDEIGGKPISYDLGETTATAAVSIDGGRVSFELPQEFERALSVTLMFDGNRMIAQGEGHFVDYWERVD